MKLKLFVELYKSILDHNNYSIIIVENAITDILKPLELKSHYTLYKTIYHHTLSPTAALPLRQRNIRSMKNEIIKTLVVEFLWGARQS